MHGDHVEPQSKGASLQMLSIYSVFENRENISISKKFKFVTLLKVLQYDQFRINVQKWISHHKHECNVAAMITGLTRMIVMKI